MNHSDWNPGPKCFCETLWMGRQIGSDGRYHDVTQSVYNPECPQHGQVGIS